MERSSVHVDEQHLMIPVGVSVLNGSPECQVQVVARLLVLESHRERGLMWRVFRSSITMKARHGIAQSSCGCAMVMRTRDTTLAAVG